MDACNQAPSDCDCCCNGSFTYTFTICDMTSGESLRADLECPYNDPISFDADECDFDHSSGGCGNVCPPSLAS